MNINILQLRSEFVSDIRGIIETAKNNAIRSIDYQRVTMYWRMGERIVVEEQQGKSRAEYGSYLLQNLANQLEPEYGSGFSYRQLAFCRQFYRTFLIVNAVRSQFNWYQYRLLIQIDDVDKREYINYICRQKINYLMS
jgi:transposase InsO family protein